jgi:hypothetical protein
MTLPTLTQLRAAIAARLESVPSIGRVHDRERYAKTEVGFRQLYHWTAPGEDEAQIRGWFLSHLSSDRRRPRVNRVAIADSWQITGFVQFEDSAAPDRTLDVLIDAITDTFSAEPTLGSLVKDLQDLASGGDDGLNGIQVAQRQTVMFAGILCVRVDLGLITYRFT